MCECSYSFKSTSLDWAREMAQSVRHLWHKHKDLSSMPARAKRARQGGVYLWSKHWSGKDWWIPGAFWLTILSELVSSRQNWDFVSKKSCSRDVSSRIEEGRTVSEERGFGEGVGQGSGESTCLVQKDPEGRKEPEFGCLVCSMSSCVLLLKIIKGLIINFSNHFWSV